MDKYITPIALALIILFVAATTLTKAQNATGNVLPPTVSKIGDIVEVSFTDIGNDGAGLTMGIRNVFLFKRTNDYSLGIGIGYESAGGKSGYLPLSGDIRWYFSHNKAASPFLNLNGGYAYNLGDRGLIGNNGTFLGLNFGINIGVTNNVSIQLALGVKVERYGYLLKDSPGYYSQDFAYLPFTIGVAF